MEPPPDVIAVASANAHKLREIREILGPLGIRCLDLGAWPEVGDLPEEGDTFEANALQKARALFRISGLPTVADDSGLEVDALGGAPGVHSRRFTPEATHEANNRELLRRLQGVERRHARFRCALALVTAAGEAVVEGRCEGRIAEATSGAGGFGYDPLFLPDETPGRTMAELAPEEKNAISHRGRAFRLLPALLARLGANHVRP